MNTSPRRYFLSIFLVSLLAASCQLESEQQATPSIDSSEHVTSSTPQSRSDEELAIIDVWENILVAVGNRNAEELRALTTEKASIAWTYLDGEEWNTRETTIEAYVQRLSQDKDQNPIAEISESYEISITEGRLATVRSPTVISEFGVPRSKEINHFIMIKDKEGWKLSSIAWTVERIPEEERAFELDLFAHNYAQVWGSKHPEFVAMFYEEDGVLQVNDGAPAEGREAIAATAQSFMTKFPDMIVQCDSLVSEPNGVAFHWTLTGTDADPNGKGHRVRISGVELWTMSEGHLIQDSKGSFSSEEYERQLEYGIANE